MRSGYSSRSYENVTVVFFMKSINFAIKIITCKAIFTSLAYLSITFSVRKSLFDITLHLIHFVVIWF